MTMYCALFSFSLQDFIGRFGLVMENEVQVIDWWRILFRRKYYLIGVWSLSIIIAGLYLLTAQKIYESKVFIQLGYLKDSGQLEKFDVLEKRLKVETENDCHKGSYPCLRKCELSTKTSNGVGRIIVLTVHALTKSEAEGFAQQLAMRLVSEHEVIYQNVVMFKRQEYEALREQIRMLEQYVEVASVSMQKGQAESPLQSASLALKKVTLFIEIWELKRYAETLRLSMVGPESAPSKIIGKPLISSDPVKPRFKMILLMSCGLGLILGVFVVFSVEFVSYVQNRQSLEKNV